MLIGLIGCIVCIALYAITIIAGFFFNKKLKDSDAENIQSDKTAGEVANLILEKYGLGTNVTEEISEDEEEEYEDEEAEEFEEDTNQSRFKFNTTKEHEETSEEFHLTTTGETYETVERINDKLNQYGVNYEERKIFLSSDIYDSKSITDVSIAAYQAMTLISECDSEKPAKYNLINFITAIPKLVLQIGWLVAVMPLFNVVNMSIVSVIILTSVVILSFILNLLNIFYPKYIADLTVEELIEEKVINQNEVEPVYDVTRALANKTVTSCFGFLRWFLRKFMGYDV